MNAEIQEARDQKRRSQLLIHSLMSLPFGGGTSVRLAPDGAVIMKIGAMAARDSRYWWQVAWNLRRNFGMGVEMQFDQLKSELIFLPPGT